MASPVIYHHHYPSPATTVATTEGSPTTSLHLSSARNHLNRARMILLLNHNHNFAFENDENAHSTIRSRKEKHNNNNNNKNFSNYRPALDLRIKHHRFREDHNYSSENAKPSMTRIDDLPSVKNDPKGFLHRSRRSVLDYHPIHSSAECPIILRESDDENKNNTNNRHQPEHEEGFYTNDGHYEDDEDFFNAVATGDDEVLMKPKFPFLKRKSDPTPTAEQIRGFFKQSFYSYPKVLAMSDLLQEDERMFGSASPSRHPRSASAAVLKWNSDENNSRWRRMTRNKRNCSNYSSRSESEEEEEEEKFQRNRRPTRASSSMLAGVSSSSRTDLMLKMKGRFRDAATRVRSEQRVVSHWSDEVEQSKATTTSRKNRALFQGAVHKVQQENSAVSHWRKDAQASKTAREEKLSQERRQKFQSVLKEVKTKSGVTSYLSKEAQETQKKKKEERKDKIKGAIRKIRMEQGVVSAIDESVTDSKLQNFKERAENKDCADEGKEEHSPLTKSGDSTFPFSSLPLFDPNRQVQLAPNSKLKPLPLLMTNLQTKGASIYQSTASEHVIVADSTSVPPTSTTTFVEQINQVSFSGLLKTLPPPPSHCRIKFPIGVSSSVIQKAQPAAVVVSPTTTTSTASPVHHQQPKKVHFQLMTESSTLAGDASDVSTAMLQDEEEEETLEDEPSEL